MISNKRYSIFISSTFEDLREERRAVQDTILSAGDFPVQMESFPAADEDQFEFIKSLINKCDYYILILAGRYGTPADDGISYTEKEYRYAKSMELPVLALLHEDTGALPANKCEQSASGRKRLEAFRNEIQSGRLRQTWSNSDNLKLAVTQALNHAKATKPAIGWVRGDTTAQQETLEDLRRVQNENASYREIIGDLELALQMPAVPDITSSIELDITPVSQQIGANTTVSGTYARVRTTWLDSYAVFFSNLSWRINDWAGEEYFSIDADTSRENIGAAIAAEFAKQDTSKCFQLSKPSYQRLHSYFVEVGLMNDQGETPFTVLGKQLARRQQINMSQSAFEIVNGELEVKSIPLEAPSFDHEIPF